MFWLPLAVTMTGPLLGGIGWLGDFRLLIYAGGAVCLLNLWLNLQSGAMRFPILPILFCLVSVWLLAPWYEGAVKGLIIWTAIESISEVASCLVRLTRRASDCGPQKAADAGGIDLTAPPEEIYRLLLPAMASAVSGLNKDTEIREVMRAVIRKINLVHGEHLTPHVKEHVVRFVAEYEQSA